MINRISDLRNLQEVLVDGYFQSLGKGINYFDETNSLTPRVAKVPASQTS